jgi:uncharacterized membrane protein
MNVSRLFAAGFLLLLAGVVLLSIGAASSSSTSFGAVVFVGPFPIAFGSGPDAGTLIIIGVLISLAMVAIFLLSFVVSRRTSRNNEQSLMFKRRRGSARLDCRTISRFR